MLSFSPNLLAQDNPKYFVTVNATEPSSNFYTPVDSNCTFSFEAIWSYGDDLGNYVQNADIHIQVNDNKNEVIEEFSVSSETGIFSFNYSSSLADKLTFKPIKLVTQDGSEYMSHLFDDGNDVYGLQSDSVEVWWDTFEVSLVSWHTGVDGTTTVAVNVTYLLIPDPGLSLPLGASYSNQTYLSKFVTNANITINGNKVQETASEGVYSANVSTWLPTAYVNVEISQEDWTSKEFGFSFDHDANKMYWVPAVIVGLTVFVGVLLVFFVRVRRADQKLFSAKNYPSLGGVLLGLLSIVCLYWGSVALDSTLNGFNWEFLAVLGLSSFVFGCVGTTFSLKKKKQALILLILNLPLFTNVIFISHSLEMYGLSVPVLQIICYLLLNFVVMYLISNADDEFT